MSKQKRAIAHPTIRDAIDWQEIDTRDPGDCPAGRVPVIRADGSRAGHVGGHSGGAVAERLLGSQGVRLGTHQGKPAWRQTKPSAPRPDPRHAKNLLAAKGSLTRNPDAPKAHARPKR